MKRIAVIGAGAIGGSLAHALAYAGLEPVLVARGDSASVIARDGLKVRRAGVDEVSRPKVVSDTRDLGPFDAVIGTLKAQDWAAAIPLIAPLVGPSTCLVPAINGIPWWYFQRAGGLHDGKQLRSLDPDGALSAAFAPERIVGGVVYMAATRPAPGVIDWPTGKRLVLGDIGPSGSGRVAELAATFRKTGMEIDESTDIRRDVWMKLLGNAGFNSVSALTRTTVAEILGDADLRAICGDTIRELLAVAASVGKTLDVAVEARLDMGGRLGAFRTSTLQDFEAGRPLETAALIDAPCEIGRLAGIPTPVLAILGRLLRNAVVRRDRTAGT
ncbi:MAG: 2-dehydropantoate 2-reductase [Proteobacteria bacterium]|nr:2-dehydropantoate 2-reductase [Pseudomonadota bacterium]